MVRRIVVASKQWRSSDGPVQSDSPSSPGQRVRELQARTAELHEAEHVASIARLRSRLDRLTVAAPTPSVERGAGIDWLGL
jgi:hypothetical protein